MHIATYQPGLIYPDVPNIDLSTYEKNLTHFVERFLDGYSGKIAIYQFGEIRTPGVSDIDLLIVTEDQDWRRAVQKAQSIINASGALLYLFTHEPVVICQSLVPCLPFLHTLENCKYIQGTWDPLTQEVSDIKDKNVKLIRHVVWNSFIRIAALELENKTIGLRRALILMHNLLTSAYGSNNFLATPHNISLSTEEIRQEILSAPFQEQEILTKTYIAQIITLLNDVDSSLDQEIQCKTNIFATMPSLMLTSRNRFLMSPIKNSKEEVNNFLVSRVLHNARIVPVPAYLMILVATLAHKVTSQVSQLEIFRTLSIPNEILQIFDTAEFAKHFEEALTISQSHEVEYAFPQPFSHQLKPIALKKRTIQQIQKRILTKYIFNA